MGGGGWTFSDKMVTGVGSDELLGKCHKILYKTSATLAPSREQHRRCLHFLFPKKWHPVQSPCSLSAGGPKITFEWEIKVGGVKQIQMTCEVIWVVVKLGTGLCMDGSGPQTRQIMVEQSVTYKRHFCDFGPLPLVHNEAGATRAWYQHCRKWMFWVCNLHPERAIYGNVGITL